MIIHFLPAGEMVTSCGLSTAGRDFVPVSDKKRDVNCQQCKAVMK